MHIWTSTTCSVFLIFVNVSLFLTSSGSREYHRRRMSLWIDRKEMLKLIGEEIDFYVVINGVLVSFLRNPGKEISSQLPVLPPEVVKVEFMWMADGDDTYSYWFKEVRSLNRDILYDPLLSIQSKGTVPKNITGFHLSFPCTLHSAGIASFVVELHLRNGDRQLIPGFPLSLHLRKRCETVITAPAACIRPCLNGGTCTEEGERCKCPAGIYGSYCQLQKGTCDIPCLNGGTCKQNHFCACAKGYTGRFCQKALCSQWCGVHGRCAEVNQCKCHRGWRGRFCNKTFNRWDILKQRTADQKAKRYKKTNKTAREKKHR